MTAKRSQLRSRWTKEKGEAEMTTDPMAKRAGKHPCLTDCALPAHFKAGEIIFREGEHADRFYLITSGKVVLEAGAGFDPGSAGKLPTRSRPDFHWRD